MYHGEIKINIIFDPLELSDDVRKIRNILNETTRDCTTKNCKSLGLKLTQTKVTKLQLEYEKLRALLHYRIKRGILNIIGSASKALFGTLDENDLQTIDANIDKLLNNQNKLSHIVQNQTAIFNVHITQPRNDTPRIRIR